jgi:hypothetical protein
MPAWLRAGLIGALILIVLSLIGMIPVVLLGCLLVPLYLAAYVGIGALAAFYMPPPRSAGQGAGQGALAGGVAAIGGGIFSIIIGTIRATVSDPQAMLDQLPPEVLDMLAEAGVDPGLAASPLGAVLSSTLCCGFGIFFAVALGALGGLIYASMKQV